MNGSLKDTDVVFLGIRIFARYAVAVYIIIRYHSDAAAAYLGETKSVADLGLGFTVRKTIEFDFRYRILGCRRSGPFISPHFKNLNF